MNIKPVASPSAIQTPQTSNNTEAKSRAIAAFMQGTQTQESNHSAQLNQNNLAPEDMSAIQAKGQSDNIEESQEVTETQTEEVKETKSVDTEAAKQFELLKRQERQMRLRAQQREQQVKAREDALKAREEAIAAKDAEYSSKYVPRERIKQNALDVLAEEGVSYDELVQQIINQSPKDPRVEAKMSALELEIKALREENIKAQERQVEQQNEAYKAAVEQIRSDVKSLVKSSDDYELIRAANATNDVVQLIEETYKKDGILLTVDQASEEVEKYLEEEAMKFTRLGKIKRKLETSVASSKPQQQTQAVSTQQTQKQPMKTLTNAAASTRQLSAKERAILAFKGELK